MGMERTDSLALAFTLKVLSITNFIIRVPVRFSILCARGILAEDIFGGGSREVYASVATDGSAQVSLGTGVTMSAGSVVYIGVKARNVLGLYSEWLWSSGAVILPQFNVEVGPGSGSATVNAGIGDYEGLENSNTTSLADSDTVENVAMNELINGTNMV